MAYGSLAVDKIENSDGFTLGGSGATMKNRIINGAMVIDQRNAGASVNARDNIFPVDRFKFMMVQNDKATGQQSSVVPAGFRNSLLITSAAATSVGANDDYSLQQPIEGFNVADLDWGTANAKTVTLSFWVRSSLTGQFGGALKNSGNNRSYPFSYTINSANTWEYETITIPGDTSGTWLTTNGVGLNVVFDLGSGSSVIGTAGSWAGSNFYGATGDTKLVATNGATFYITGVQLEVGSQATSFDYRQYGTELQLCQRYCVKYGGSNSYEFAPFTTLIAAGGATAYGLVASSVPMRTVPTYTSSTLRLVDETAGYAVTSVSSSGNSYGNNYGTEVGFTVASGLTQYRPYFIQTNGSTSGYLLMSAEL